MGYRYVGLGKQTDWGSTVAVSTYIDIISESMGHTRNMITPQTVGFYSPAAQCVGLYKPSGSIESLGVADDIMYWLHMLMENTATTPLGGGKYKHEFKPNQTVNYYTVSIGKETYERLYNSMFCTSWTVGVASGEVVTNSFSVLSKEDEIGSIANPSFSNDRAYFHHVGAVVTIGSDTQTAYIKNIEVSITGNADEDNYCVGDQTLKGAVRKNYEVTVSADIRFDTEKELKRFYDGLSTGSTGKGPSTAVSTFAITITLTDANSNILVITLPAVVWDTESANMSEKEHVVENLTGKCIHDATTGAAVKVELTNNRTGV